MKTHNFVSAAVFGGAQLLLFVQSTCPGGL